MTKTNGNTKGVTEERPRALFNPGVIVITKGVKRLLDEAKLDPKEVCTFVGRHVSGDWGELDHIDKRQNEDALHNGSRLFSAYRSLAGTKFWVITEAKNDKGYRESTCILMPDEY